MKFTLAILALFPLVLFGQNDIREILNQEYEQGRFNGTALYVDNGNRLAIHKGFSNFQFGVEINGQTRFPIASVTKLFTSIAVLQLKEKGGLDLGDPIAKFIPNLPENCHHITIHDLLIHHSGLENEPIEAVVNQYSIDRYIDHFVKKSSNDSLKFNYNNVDFVLLSKVIEKITKKEFHRSIEDLIIKPLKMENTAFIREREITKNLAYGYHNYSFGEGAKDDPLFNDRRFLSNYYGAGGMYSTTDDLHTLLMAIKDNRLISAESKAQFLLKPQSEEYVDWLSGKPTLGLYFDDAAAVYRRSGGIDGFNAQVIINEQFDKILIILSNTDTADLQRLANRIYFGG